jgi:hypothetical protein
MNRWVKVFGIAVLVLCIGVHIGASQGYILAPWNAGQGWLGTLDRPWSYAVVKDGVYLDGATLDDYEMLIAPDDPAADVTVTIPALTMHLGPAIHIFETQDTTVGKTVALADEFETQSNDGLAGPETYTLPEVSTVGVGTPFRFIVADAHTVNIDPAAADLITPTCNAAGDKLQNTGAVGSYVEIIAIDDTNWAITSSSGTWSDDN